jgi:integrase
MQEYVVNRPDEGAMRRALTANGLNAAGAILRLAWQAGLQREEIEGLTWEQVDFLDQKLVLPDRSVPIPEDFAAWLRALREDRDRRQERVVLSDRDRKPLKPQSISRLARTALDREGQNQVRLIDLRNDFIIRQLGEHDWQYVSRISGVEAAGLNVHFGSYLEEKRVSTRICREEPVEIDEFALWKLLRAEGSSPAAVTLWLTWQTGLQLEEITSLRWEQVDLEKERLYLEDRTMPLSGGALGALRALRGAEQETEYVLTSPRSRQPFDRTRLSKLARAALIRAGLDDVTLRDLRVDCGIRSGGEGKILALVRRKRSITRNDVMMLLEVSRTTAYNRLKQMVRRGKLVQVGARYYLPEEVVAPERQSEVILEYIGKEGFAYRQDVARLLGIEAGQCRPILQRMITAGQLEQVRQKYILSRVKEE